MLNFKKLWYSVVQSSTTHISTSIIYKTIVVLVSFKRNSRCFYLVSKKIWNQLYSLLWVLQQSEYSGNLGPTVAVNVLNRMRLLKMRIPRHFHSSLYYNGTCWGIQTYVCFLWVDMLWYSSISNTLYSFQLDIEIYVHKLMILFILFYELLNTFYLFQILLLKKLLLCYSAI